MAELHVTYLNELLSFSSHPRPCIVGRWRRLAVSRSRDGEYLPFSHLLHSCFVTTLKGGGWRVISLIWALPLLCPLRNCALASKTEDLDKLSSLRQIKLCTAQSVSWWWKIAQMRNCCAGVLWRERAAVSARGLCFGRL